MNRINSILSFINEDDYVADIGCDQAQLSILLAKRNQKSIACDISEKVIESARKKIYNLKLNDLIDLRVSNGLDGISNKVDTIVLSGMGTYTILSIIKSCDLTFKKIITISNNNHDILRSEMNKLNYIVQSEMIIKENNKYYNLILFIKGNKKYTKKEILLGLNHVDKEMYIEYLNYLKKKYNKIIINSKNKNIKILEYLKYIDDII